MAWVLRVEDNLMLSWFSFHHVGSGNQTQGIRLGGKHLYLLSHFTGPMRYFNIL